MLDNIANPQAVSTRRLTIYNIINLESLMLNIDPSTCTIRQLQSRRKTNL